MGYFCPFTALTAQKMKISKIKKKYLEESSFYTSVPKIMIICYTIVWMWCRCENGWKKWTIEVGAPPKKLIFWTECNFHLFGMKKNNCKPHSLIQTLIYTSNIYYSKIYQREDWKNNSSILHLEVWTRCFRHRYSINSLGL